MLKIKQLRTSKGWTQTEFAKQSGLSQSFINNLEAGTKQPTLTTLNKLASALGVSVPELLAEVEQSATKEVV